MREIEFRAKSTKTGESVLGYYGFAEGNPYIADWDKGFPVKRPNGKFGREWHTDVDPETVEVKVGAFWFSLDELTDMCLQSSEYKRKLAEKLGHDYGEVYYR